MKTNAPDKRSAREFAQRDYRTALGAFATGVTVLTALDDGGGAVGVTINSFASVSLDPPLVLWSLARKSPVLPVFRNCRGYVINVLSADQLELSNRFAGPDNGRREDKFASLKYASGIAGAALLEGCCAWLECRNEIHHEGGDHLIFIGLVQSYRHEHRPPLVFHRGSYRTLA